MAELPYIKLYKCPKCGRYRVRPVHSGKRLACFSVDCDWAEKEKESEETMSRVKTPNCVVLNLHTGMTHYSTCDHENKITENRTFCGKLIHDGYEVKTTDMWHNTARCKVCDMKERGMRGSKEHWLHKEHWLYVAKEKESNDKDGTEKTTE